MWFRKKNIDQTAAAGALSGGDRMIVAQGSSAEGKHTLLSTLAAWLFGSVAITGGTISNVSVTGLPAPTNASDAATKSYVDALALNVGSRAAVRLASTANVVISTDLAAGQTIDGKTIAAGDLILLKNQTAPAANGIYVAPASGAAARAAQFDTWSEFPGSLIAVEEGSTNADTMWLCTSDQGGTIGVTAIAFTRIRIDISVPVTTAQGGLGQDASAFSGVLRFVAGVPSAVPAGKGILLGSTGISADPAYHRSYLAGLGLSTAGGSSTFGIAAGVATDSINAALMLLGSAYTKTTSAWALGTAAGSLDTGAIANNTWYHVWLIQRPDTGVVDVLTSLSATAPTLPTNYTLLRRIGSMKTNGSAQWTKFIQDGDLFQWDAAVVDVNGAANPGAAAVTRTLSTPLGVRCEAIVNVNFLLSAGALTDNPAAILLSDLSISDQTPSVTGALTFENYYSATTLQSGAVARVFTNTSSQIRSRMVQSSANTSLYITTQAWVDRRGRDA